MPMQSLSFNQQIEAELSEREWHMFESLKQWTEQQRDAWRSAWRSWRQKQLSAIHNGQAQVQIHISSECIGCFDCEIMCPEIFYITKKRSRIKKEALELNAQQKAFINPKIMSICWSDLQLAKEACPVEAIKLQTLDASDPEPTPELFN